MREQRVVGSRFRRLPSPTITVLVSVMVVIMAACSSSDGRTLQDPEVEIVPTPTAADGQSFVVPPGDFRLASPDFVSGDILPAPYTFESGPFTSPRLQWGEVPEGAEELAVVLTDVTRGVVHWVLTGIDPTLTGLEQNVTPPGAVSALNNFGQLGYAPPALQEDGQHEFVFTLYAMFQAVNLDEGLETADAIRLVEESTMASTDLIVFYG